MDGKDDGDITAPLDTEPKKKNKVGRPAGRPKLSPGEKGRYNLSAKTKAKNKIKRRIAARNKKIKPDRTKISNLNVRNKEDRKKIQALDGGGVVSDKQVESNLLEDEQELVFRANPGPQTDFLASPEKEVLYGGAAGGGKSYSMLVDLLRYADNTNHRALLLRRTLSELTELIDQSKQMYLRAFPKARFKESTKTWHFPSGATALFSYVDKDDDVYRYQGQSFTWIGIDELGHYPTPYVWNYLRSRLRTADPSIETYARASANPGGVGGWWIKKMFIDPMEPNTPFWATDIDTGKPLVYGPNHKKAGEPLFHRKFIPARLTDNPYLMRTGEYEAMLHSLPEVERRRLLDGDWDVSEGAAFSEFSRNIHVVEPFEIPSGWPRIRSGDYGYSSPSCILWGAVDWDGNLWIYRELYAKGYTGEALAKIIREMERLDTRMSLSVLDKSCWNRTGLGPSIAETMIREGVRWIPSDSNRMSGKIEVHRRLAPNDMGDPRLRIFATCTNLVRTLPTIPLSKSNSEDVDTRSDDHAYDALRYMCMTRQVSAPQASVFRNAHMRPPELMDATFGY